MAIVGTRPQYIKLAPIYHAINKKNDIKLLIVDTGQHYDDEMSKFILNDLEIKKIDYNLNIKETQHGMQTGRMMTGLEPLFHEHKIDHCIVFGDTNSTIAGAIVARKLKIPTTHVEAGIRMHDINMAEELNRRISDSICNYLFAPSQLAVENLKKENQMGKIFFSGDIMFDAVKMFQKNMSESQSVRDLVPKGIKYILMTLHRAENVDNPDILRKTFENLGKIPAKIVFPAHPRTRKRIQENNIAVPDNLSVILPLAYLELLYHVKESELVITDSGGLQKESYYLGKRSVVLYPETPWPELEKLDAIILASPDNINQKVIDWLGKEVDNSERPYGDGNSTEIILKEILPN